MRGVGSAWAAVIYNFIKELGFQPSQEDTDVCMHTPVNKSVQGKTNTKTNARLVLESVLDSLSGASVPCEKLPVGE